MISSALNVESNKIEATCSNGTLKQVILNVWNEAVVPKVHLLSGQASDQLIHDARRKGHLLRLQKVYFDGFLSFKRACLE